MKDFLKRIKADYLLSSILTIAFGIALIIGRAAILKAIGSVLAIILIILGVIYVGSYFIGATSNSFSAVMGAFVLAIGVWFLVNPEVIVGFIPKLIGMIFFFHGIRGILEAMVAKGFQAKTWKAGIIMSIISLVIGLLCMINAFGIMKNALALVGILLIYNGVSNIFIAGTSSRAERKYNKGETIDSSFVEDRDR